jgi:hypothetical protein
MKTLLFLLLTATAFGQNEKSGVYLTFNDYLSNKLSYEINCKTEKHTIRLNDFLNQSFIKVIHNDKKIKLQKDRIYGFISCNESLVRFQNKEHYYLVEKGPVWIFYKEVPVTQVKGLKLEKQYYFSAKGDEKIIALTINNIKQAFPDNHKFHDMIDAQFQNTGISEYDTFHKVFKVNHILQQSTE